MKWFSVTTVIYVCIKLAMELQQYLQVSLDLIDFFLFFVVNEVEQIKFEFLALVLPDIFITERHYWKLIDFEISFELHQQRKS
jgi:hypothetical protein